MKQQAIVLFGHGSRETRWVEPFELLAEGVRKRRPGVEVRLAFLELTAPDLPGAVAQLIAGGVQSIRIVPVFLGQGGHVRGDLPTLVDALRRQHPSIDIQCVPAVGEDPAVLEALAGYCVRDLP